MLASVLCVAILTGIVAVIIAGPWALAYIALYILATVPGWPLAAPCSAVIIRRDGWPVR